MNITVGLNTIHMIDCPYMIREDGKGAGWPPYS